ncbi:MAG: DUF11 domain-containing protein [Chloroflexi bacterium]|nr:DUF11 domain-containing protein [Chloroflexota bacterium]
MPTRYPSQKPLGQTSDAGKSLFARSFGSAGTWVRKQSAGRGFAMLSRLAAGLVLIILALAAPAGRAVNAAGPSQPAEVVIHSIGGMLYPSLDLSQPEQLVEPLPAARPPASPAPSGVAALTQAGIPNGGFEAGSLAPWTSSGSANHVEILTAANFTPPVGNPTEGTHFVLLCTGPATVTGAGQGNIDGDLSNTPEFDTSILTQVLNLTVSDVPAILSFDWIFLTAERASALDPFDDIFRVQLNNSNILVGSRPGGISPFPDINANAPGAIVSSPPGGNSTNGCNFPIRTNFSKFSTIITDPGTYTLQFLVADQGDANVDSGLLIDNVKLSPELDVSVTKSATPDPAVAGQPLVYDLTVKVDGIGTATGVVVTDTLPAEVDYLTDTSNGACIFNPGPRELVCNLGDILGNTSRSFKIDTRVKEGARAGGALKVTNSLVVTSISPDRDLSNNTFNLQTILRDQADLKISKVSKPDTNVRAGDLFTYTIFVDNYGPSAARNVVVTDTILSSGAWQFVSCTPLETPQGAIPGSLSCGPNNTLNLLIATINPLPPLSPQNPGRYTLQVVLRANQAQDVNNAVRVTSDTPDTDTSNNQATDFIHVDAVADLKMTKIGTDIGTNPDGNPFSVLAGQSVQWTIVISNAGPSTSQNVVVVDRLPAGLVKGSIFALATTPQPGGGQCNLGTPSDFQQPLRCQLGNLLPGQIATVIIQADIDPSYVANQVNTQFANYLPNDAFLTTDTLDPDTRNNIVYDALVRVDALANLIATKVDQPDPVRAGKPLAYIITISNTGPSTAENVVLSDTLPANVTFQSASIVNGNSLQSCTFSAGAQSVYCSLGNLPPAPPTVTVLINTLVNIDAPAGPITNIANVTSDTNDGNPANNTNISAVTQVLTEADLDIINSVTDTPDPVVAGTILKYHIHVINHGPSQAPTPTITNTFTFAGNPAGAGFVTFAGATELCSPVGVDQIVCNLQTTLPPAGAHSFDLFVKVSPSFIGVITDTATTSSPVFDPILANNTFVQDTRVTDQADLSITKIGDPDVTVVAGELLTYTITVDNYGPSDARNLVLTDTLDPKVTFVSAATSAPSTRTGPNPLVWSFTNRLAAGGRISVTVVVRANSDIGRPFDAFSNRVEVRSSAFDPDLTNNAATLFTAPVSFADLAVTKAEIGQVANVPGPGISLLPNRVTAGLTLTYTLKITNNGPSSAENVVLIDRLPPGLTVLPGGITTSPGGSCTAGTPGQAADKLTCGFGTLAAGASAAITITATVDPAVVDGTILANDAQVYSDAFDPNNTNNYVTNLTRVDAVADVSVTKTDFPDPVIAGQQLEYEIIVENAGPSVSRDVVIEDFLPFGLGVLRVNMTNNPAGFCSIRTTPNEVIDCTLGDLPPGKRLVIVVTGLVDPRVPEGAVLTNDVQVFNPNSNGTADPDLTNNEAIEDTDVLAVADLVIQKSDKPEVVYAGTQKKYTVTVTNKGPSDALNVVVTDTLPGGAGYQVDTASCDVDAAHPAYEAIMKGPNESPPVTNTIASGLASFILDKNTRQLSYFVAVTDITRTITAGHIHTGTAGVAGGVLIPIPNATSLSPGNPIFGTLDLSGGDKDALVNNLLAGGGGFYINFHTAAHPGGEIRGQIYPAPARSLGCPLGTIPAGETRTFDIFALVLPEAVPGTIITNTATVISTVFDPNLANNTSDTYSGIAIAKNLVLGQADLRVTKFGKPDGDVRAGTNLTYTIIVDNLGTGFAHNVVLTELLQSSNVFTMTSITSDRPAICSPTAPPDLRAQERLQFQCQLQEPLEVLTPNASGRWIITVVVHGDQTQDINNFAIVTSEDFDPDTTNNKAFVEHNITDVSDLRITKAEIGEVQVNGQPGGVVTLVPNQVTAGRDLTYTLSIHNFGPSIAENVIVYDRLPPGIVLTGYESSAGFCTTGTPGNPQDQMKCGVGTLYVNYDATITITAHVLPSLDPGTILENDAFVISDIFDPTNANNYATNLTTVSTWADLSISKSARGDNITGYDTATGQFTKTQLDNQVTAGELLQYTLVITNGGPSDARGVILTDTLPAPAGPLAIVNFVSADGALCRQDPVDRNVVVCTLDTIPVGGKRTVHIVVRVDPTVPNGTVITNNVVVSAATRDPFLANNSATNATTVNAVADVWITKVDVPAEARLDKPFEPDQAVAGKEHRYQITFGNNGISAAQNVVITDVLDVKQAAILGETLVRCEPIDPDDQVTCSQAAGIVTVTGFKHRNETVLPGALAPASNFRFYLVTKVDSGYVLDAAAGKFLAELPGWGPIASDTAFISSTTTDVRPQNNRDTEQTEIIAEADLVIAKTDSTGAFLAGDPVVRGGEILYTITVTNTGPSDAAQVYVVDWLPAGLILDPNLVTVTVPAGSVVVEKRDDGRITVILGNDLSNAGTPQSGRINTGHTYSFTIRVRVANTAPCGAVLQNRATVETRRNDTIWPPVNGFARTPTLDPNPANNTVVEGTLIVCPSIQVNKTVSFDGTCPGTDNIAVAKPGVPITFCYQIKNTGDTFLDTIRITDTFTTRQGTQIIFTDLITFGLDVGLPIAPGETVTRSVRIPSLYFAACGTNINQVIVTAIPTNSGRTVLLSVPGVSAKDEARVDVPCEGVDFRLQLPILDNSTCQSYITIQNYGDAPTKAMVVIWGQPGYCPPQATGPIKIECTGLLLPGSSWVVAPSHMPAGAHSAVVYSMNAVDKVRDSRGNLVPFSDIACYSLYQNIVFNDAEWYLFDQAYRNQGIYYGPVGVNGSQLQLDFGAHQGEPLAVEVDRTCPGDVTPGFKASAAYTGISSDMEGAPDPTFGGYAYYVPLIYTQGQGGYNTTLWIQNSGDQCTSVEIYFQKQDNCLHPTIGEILTLAPGETIGFDPASVLPANPPWQGSAWVRASKPLGVVVDVRGKNMFGSYVGVPAQLQTTFNGTPEFSFGTAVNYAPLIYREYNGWQTGIQVQNLSSVTNAKVKVYFVDHTGGIIATVVDWICPRGSQTFFLPVINGLPGNYVGAARIESQNWWTPGDPSVQAPNVLSVVNLVKYADQSSTTTPLEMAMYNALPEWKSFDWQIGKPPGLLGMGLLGVPLVSKGALNQIYSELAIQNLNPNPGFTDFAIFFYDQNGLLDTVCEKLNEKQVEYIDLASWGFVPNGFNGSVVISATRTTQPGGFGLAGVVVERIGRSLTQPQLQGDETKAYEMFPMFFPFTFPVTPTCPGQP